mgnify:FL=1
MYDKIISLRLLVAIIFGGISIGALIAEHSNKNYKIQHMVQKKK